MQYQLKSVSSRSLCSSSSRCFWEPSYATSSSFICWVSYSALGLRLMGQLGCEGALQACRSCFDSYYQSSCICTSQTWSSCTAQLYSSALPALSGSKTYLVLKFLSTGWQLPLKTSAKQYFQLVGPKGRTWFMHLNFYLQWLYLTTTSYSTGGASQTLTSIAAQTLGLSGSFFISFSFPCGLYLLASVCFANYLPVFFGGYFFCSGLLSLVFTFLGAVGFLSLFMMCGSFGFAATRGVLDFFAGAGEDSLIPVICSPVPFINQFIIHAHRQTH